MHHLIYFEVYGAIVLSIFPLYCATIIPIMCNSSAERFFSCSSAALYPRNTPHFFLPASPWQPPFYFILHVSDYFRYLLKVESYGLL